MDKDLDQMNQEVSGNGEMPNTDETTNTTDKLDTTENSTSSDAHTGFNYYNQQPFNNGQPTYNNDFNSQGMNQNQDQNQNQNQNPNGGYYNPYNQQPFNQEPFQQGPTGYRSSFTMKEEQDPNKNGKKKGKKKKVLTLCGIIVLGIIVGTAAFSTGSILRKNSVKQQQSSETLSSNNGSSDNNDAQNGEGALKEDESNTNSTGPTIGSTETVDSSKDSGVSAVVESALPSIVMINCNVTTTQYGQSVTGVASGSGIIIKEDDNTLYIVTNYHVVEDAESISIVFNDEESVDAKLKAYDSTNDLAVLKISLDDLKDSTKSSIKVATLGSSDDLKVGAMAIAIGNALGYGQSVTVGYVSALDRAVTIDETTRVLLQTDAAINPGNSGGALLDVNGKVIGINSAKYSSTEVEGVCYAIPISKAIPIINDLLTKETLSDEEKGYLGISGSDVDETAHAYYNVPLGVLVASVESKGAADEAGIKEGDIITAVNGIEVTSISALKERVNSYKYGTEITITIQRKNDGTYEEKEIKVTLQKGTSTDSSSQSDNGSSSQSQDGSSDYYDYYNYYGNQSGDQGQDGYSWPWSN